MKINLVKGRDYIRHSVFKEEGRVGILKVKGFGINTRATQVN